ncbi:LysR family transcriptional regulator [Reyranella sp.]|uniref:LysR family transcriptional regulator n=1 Tax=Reyranella sp. TaxID=1929291 RepID=UPI003BAD6D50
MIRRLEMALALDTHRSFQRAARSLGISQPALTRALQVLEAELGARLFERGKSECAPTEFGRVALVRARRIVSEVAEARREVALLQGLQIGEFRIGAGSFATQVWLGRAIGEVCAAHPRLRIRSTEHPWHQLPDALMASELDIAVGEASDLKGNDEIVVGRLPRRAGMFVCRAGHPLVARPSVTIDDIARYSLVGPLLPRRIALHLPATSALGALSADGRHYVPSVLCTSWLGIGDVVAGSDALGIAARASLPMLPERLNLVPLPFSAPWLCTEQALMWRHDRMKHPALKAFREAARRCEAATMAAAKT